MTFLIFLVIRKYIHCYVGRGYIFITRKMNNNRYLWIPSSKNVTFQLLFEWHTCTYIYEWYTNKHISIKMQTKKNFPCCYRFDSVVNRCVRCVIKFDGISLIYKKRGTEIINFIPPSNIQSKSTCVMIRFVRLIRFFEYKIFFSGDWILFSSCSRIFHSIM